MTYIRHTRNEGGKEWDGSTSKRSRVFFADYTDENRKRVRRSTKCKTTRKALEQLAVWENHSREVRNGIRAAKVEHLIKDAAAEYYRASQATERYKDHNQVQITRVCEFNNWTHLGQITAAAIEAFIDTIAGSNRSKQSHIVGLRTFCRWCVSRGKLPSDPSRTVKAPPVGKSKRRQLEQAEWKLLESNLLSADDDRNGMTAHERRMLYWTAIETGLRSAELRSLTKADLRLIGDDPHILIDQARTKHGRDAKQYVSDGLAAKLREFVLRKHPDAPVFIVKRHYDLATVFRHDCLAAGLKNTSVLDFHCLRHTCGSWLAAAGVPLHQVQRVMRHSSIVLTIDRYGHLSK